MVREYTYKGKTLSELKKMELKEVAKLLPARARRSLLRSLTDAQKNLLKKVNRANNGVYKRDIKTHCRDMIIIPSMVGLNIYVYNGKLFNKLVIIPEMIGHYLGEFSLTRKGVKHSAPGVGATKSSAAVSVK